MIKKVIPLLNYAVIGLLFYGSYKTNNLQAGLVTVSALAYLVLSQYLMKELRETRNELERVLNAIPTNYDQNMEAAEKQLYDDYKSLDLDEMQQKLYLHGFLKGIHHTSKKVLDVAMNDENSK